MKLTVIGCNGAYPSANQATSCYLLQTKGKNILLDMGSGSLSKLQNYVECSEIDMLIVGHYHADHTADIGCLQHQVMIEKMHGKRHKNLDIYVPDYIGDISAYDFDDCVYACGYNADSVLNFGDIKITFSENIHAIPSFAVKIYDGEQTFVYTGDTGYYDKLVDFAEKSHILLSECSMFDTKPNDQFGHLSCEQAGDLAQKADVRNLVLTHLPNGAEKEQFKIKAQTKFNGNICMAHEGFCVSV